MPHGFHGVGKEGNPIYIERIGKAQIDEMYNAETMDRMLRYYTRTYESAMVEKYPAASKAAGKRIHQYITIFDCEGLSMKILQSRVKE